MIAVTMTTGWAVFCALAITATWLVAIACDANVVVAFIAGFVVMVLLYWLFYGV